MYRKTFLKLYEAKKESVEKTGKKSPDWFLGYVEGFGNQKLTGYQIGALYHLMVLPDSVESEVVTNENLDITEENNLFSSGLS